MRWSVVVLPRARRDYYLAIDYLSDFYPGTPVRFHQKYARTLLQLQDNPFGWSVCYACPDYRRAIVGKYTLLYKIVEERHEVHIHRLLRGSWDIPRIMREDESES